MTVLVKLPQIAQKRISTDRGADLGHPGSAKVL